MKTVLLFLLLSINFIAQSQIIKATATRQHWAGGVCCVTGTNYVITITGSIDSLNNSEFHQAYIDGNEFSINKEKDTKNTYTILRFNFGISKNHYRENIKDDIEEIKKESFIKENFVSITYNGQSLKIPIEPITELFYLAYP